MVGLFSLSDFYLSTISLCNIMVAEAFKACASRIVSCITI